MRGVILCAPVVLVCIVSMLFFVQARAAYAGILTEPINIQRQYWAHQLSTVQPQTVYQEFTDEAQKASPEKRHVAAHIFGAELYKAIGPGALALCTTDFASGCIHEVFKAIISDGGIESLKENVDDCERLGEPSQCRHAIGHGLVSFKGYSPESLQSALDVCQKSFYEDPINGCVGGVFMEYNLYTMKGPEMHVRPVSDLGWYDVCPSLDTTFKQACYTWLPQWWSDVLKLEQELSSHERFTYMGRLCREVPEPEYRQDCFERLGQHTAYAAKFDPMRIREFCAAASPDALDQLSCRAYAAFITTYSDTHMLEKALDVCSSLSSTAEAYCESYARNENSKQHPLPVPTRESLAQ